MSKKEQFIKKEQFKDYLELLDFPEENTLMISIHLIWRLQND